MPTEYHIWILNAIQYIIIVSGQVVVVFHNMKPALRGQTDRNAINRVNNIHYFPHLYRYYPYYTT